jgi:hypothetical protein
MEIRAALGEQNDMWALLNHLLKCVQKLCREIFVGQNFVKIKEPGRDLPKNGPLSQSITGTDSRTHVVLTDHPFALGILLEIESGEAEIVLGVERELGTAAMEVRI